MRHGRLRVTYEVDETQNAVLIYNIGRVSLPSSTATSTDPVRTGAIMLAGDGGGSSVS